MAEYQFEEKKGGYGKILIWVLLVIFLFGGVFVWYKYYFVFGEGVKSGYLNYAVKKGYVFKTYEGKIIQEGLAREERARLPVMNSNFL